MGLFIFQHGCLYWTLRPELFLYRRSTVFPLHGLLTQTCCGKSMFSPFLNIILPKTGFSEHTTDYSAILHGFHFSASKNMSTDSCSSKNPLFDLSPFWMVSKEIFLQEWKNTCYEPVLNNTEFKLWKKLILLIWKKIPFFIEWTT